LMDGNICSSESGKPPVFLSGQESHKAWVSPDGEIIVYQQIQEHTDRPPSVTLWAVNRDGSNGRILIEAHEMLGLVPEEKQVVLPEQIEWLPGTHSLIFNTTWWGSPWIGINDDLHMINADTGELETLFAPGDGGFFYFSPNGNYLALATSESIKLVSTKSWGNLNMFEFQQVGPAYHNYFYPHPVWAMDSKSIMAAIPLGDLGIPEPTTLDIWEMNISGRTPKQTAHFSLTYQSGQWPYWRTSFSPDLSKIAYINEHWEDEEKQDELHIASVDGSSDEIYYTAEIIKFEGWEANSLNFNFRDLGEDLLLTGSVGKSSVQAAPTPLPTPINHPVPWELGCRPSSKE
ncbi:MAG: hypothetical protein OEZ02_04760, partial [Anaerolineae bacterium]|nr:hypothetical protein [Anaerolineae bacterium]